MRPGWFFLPQFYLDRLPPHQAEAARAIGAFRHFLTHRPPRQIEPRLSPYFDPLWYAAQHPAAVEAVRSGALPSLLAHYLQLCDGALPDPLPQFSERIYLAQYPDVAAAVRGGQLFSGYEHFLQFGQHEGRIFGRGPDLSHYRAMNPAVAVGAGLPDLFAHLVMHDPRPEAAPPAAEETAALLRMQAEIGLRQRRLHPLDFTLTSLARVSVVMSVADPFALTVATLASLQAQLSGELELILIGREPALQDIRPLLRGAHLLVNPGQTADAGAWNRGLQAATADAVLLLRSDARPAPGAVAHALMRLRAAPLTGAVGGMVLSSNGTVQEAGSILRRDGTVGAYMQGASPLAPEVRFLRGVDFCSGRFLMLDAAMARRLGGFDPALPTGHAEAALCLQLREAGHRVVYDPKIRVEQASAGRGAPNGGPVPDGAAALRDSHAMALRRQPGADVGPHVARSPDRRRRVLMIEDRIPLRRSGSGYGRSNDIIHMLDQLGFQVTVLGLEMPLGTLQELEADFPETVEILHDLRSWDLPEVLAKRRGGFETIWLCRAANLDRVAQQVQGAAPRLILDTEAIASLRDQQAAGLAGHAFDRDAALAAEFSMIGLADQVLAVSAAEARILRDLGHPRVGVLGHMLTPRPAPGPEGRQGLLFLGAIHDQRVPNYESLIWFVANVLETLAADSGPPLRLTIAGHRAWNIDMSPFENHPQIDLLGPVADLAPLFDRHRIFVAPTRIAAGIPHKLHEAAAHGLPAVASTLLCEQLGWQDGQEILAARTGDAGAFAQQIRRLHGDDLLWRGLQGRAQQRLVAENAPEVFRAAIAGIMAQDEAPP